MNAPFLFVDWLSIWQVHPAHAPQNSGSIITYDGAANTLFTRTRAARVQGSHSTSCRVKSDGSCVVLDGNFGRLNRADNLFNLDPLATFRRANAVAEFAGLPPFSLDDQRNHTGPPTDHLASVGHSERDFSEGRASSEFVHLSRVDLTQNYSCGSLTAARALIRGLQGKNVSRVKKGVGGDSSVWWSNTRYMVKFYIKSDEMAAHGCTEGKAYEFAKQNGIVRMELELKRRELFDLGWSNFNEFLKAWDMGQVHELFAEYEAIMEMKSISNDAEFLDSLPSRLRVHAAAFLAGRDVRSLMSRSAFFRYRKVLLEYGIDISDERPTQLNVSIRTINVEPVAAPDWYWKDAA